MFVWENFYIIVYRSSVPYGNAYVVMIFLRTTFIHGGQPNSLSRLIVLSYLGQLVQPSLGREKFVWKLFKMWGIDIILFY